MEVRKLLLQAMFIARRPHLADVSLRIYAGDFVAILGSPGSGKTTLLRILGLLEPPDSGDLFLEGRLVTGLPHGALEPLPLLLVDDPTPDTLTMLRRLNLGGQTVVMATADPELAAHGRTLHLLRDGTLRLVTSEWED